MPDFGVVIDKLQRTVPYLGNASTAPISRPGCWAYPDMLEVGNFNSGAIAHAESRTHFGGEAVPHARYRKNNQNNPHDRAARASPS